MTEGNSFLKPIVEALLGALPKLKISFEKNIDSKDTFDIDESRISRYLAEFKDYLNEVKSKNVDREPVSIDKFTARQSVGLINCLGVNLLSLARGVAGHEKRSFIYTNAMCYDKIEQHLCMWLSSDLQSFYSVSSPWPLPVDASKYMSSPGVCVRAFGTGAVQFFPDMKGQLKRQDEPIESMLAIPVKSLLMSPQSGAISTINVVTRKAGIFPQAISAQMENRIDRVRNLALSLSEMKTIIEGR